MGFAPGFVKHNRQTEVHVPVNAGICGLRQFGEVVERGEPIAVGLGGVIVPGEGAFSDFHPGTEYGNHESGSARKGAGASAGAGARPRPSPAEAATGAPPHPVGHLADSLRHRVNGWRGGWVTEREIDELVVYYPDVALTASSSRYEYITLRAKPFPLVSDGFQLVFELPHPRSVHALGDRLRTRQVCEREDVLQVASTDSVIVVPSIRVWARWQGGPLFGAPAVSHHQLPDMSMCVCMAYEWILGAQPIIDLVSMSVLWTAKLLHEALIGSYPGRQHYGALARLRRDRRHEFCGCGSDRRYDACHRHDDLNKPYQELLEEADLGRRQYFRQLYLQRRPVAPPRAAWL